MTKEQRAAYMRAYYHKNREKWLARNRAAYAKDPAKKNAQNRKWVLANRDKVNAMAHAWALANPDKVRARTRAWYWRHRDKVRAKVLFEKHGLTPAERADAIAWQDGKCAICLDVASLVQDHDHALANQDEAARGMLCSPCNTSLGGFRDDPSLLRAAADYLDGGR